MDGNVWLNSADGAVRRRFRWCVAVHRLSVALVRAPCVGSGSEECVDIARSHDGPITHKGLVVVLDAVMVVEIVDHDAEGFLDAAWRVVAEPIDPFEPCAIAEVKARYGVDTASGGRLPRQIQRAKPHQDGPQPLAFR